MTDKNRLEEFREFIDFMHESIDIEDHQRFVAISESMIKDGWFKWIYRYAKEQAERVQELEEENKLLKFGYKNNTDAGFDVLNQNKRYREALEFYANENVWIEREVVILMDREPEKAYDTPLALDDSGCIARKALEESE